MKVTEAIQHDFLDFLAKQGITVEFLIEIKHRPVYQCDSLTDFFQVCIDQKISPMNFFDYAFDWYEATNLDAMSWEYHDKLWKALLKEKASGNS